MLKMDGVDHKLIKMKDTRVNKVLSLLLHLIITSDPLCVVYASIDHSRRGAAELIIKPCPLAARICCTFSPTTFSSVQGYTEVSSYYYGLHMGSPSLHHSSASAPMASSTPLSCWYMSQRSTPVHAPVSSTTEPFLANSVSWPPAPRYFAHFISFYTISNVLRCVYGRIHRGG